MRKFATLVWLVLTLCEVCAQEMQHPEYRFLFLVDSSWGMRLRKEATVDVVRSVVRGGFGNQIQEDEKFGVWTFNDQLNTRGFPPQTWKGQDAELIAEVAAQYVVRTPFTRPTSMLPALAAAQKYASAGRTMMIILLCNGEEGIFGTPQDDEINRFFTEHLRVMQRERRPFVVAIAYEEGKAVAARGFGAGTKVDLPMLERKTVADVVPAVPPVVQVAEREEPKKAVAAERKKTEEVQKEPEEPVLVQKTSEEPPPVVAEKVTKDETTPVVKEEAAPEEVAVIPKAPEVVKEEPPSTSIAVELAPEPPLVAEEKPENVSVREEPRVSPTPVPKEVPIAVVPAVQQARSIWPFVCMGLGAAGLLVYGVWQRKAAKSKARSLISQSLEK